MELETVCRICLAVDRKLEPPGKYASLLNLLAPDACGCIPLPAAVCWECRATLRRVRTFAGRAQRSAVMLLQVWDATRCGDVQQPLEMLAFQCISSLQCHTEINCIPSAQPNTENVHNSDYNENEERDRQTRLAEVNGEFHIKTESKFDVYDDVPLIKHTRLAELNREFHIKTESKFNVDNDVPLIEHTQLAEVNAESHIKTESKLYVDEDVPLIKHKKIKENKKRRTKKEQNSIEDVKLEFSSERIADDDLLDGEKVESSSDIKNPTKKKKKILDECSKKIVTRKKKSAIQMPPECERFRTVLVSEEQLMVWRAADAKVERYATLRLPHKCTSCLLPFRWAEQLQRHNANKHHPSLGDWMCDICECRYPDSDSLSAHRQLHLTRYECLHCDHSTRDKREIDKHYEMLHCEAKYKCRVCGEAFNTFFQQRYHREAAHRPLWQCPHCDKTFRLRGGLYSHMRIHQQLPQAECPICEKVCKNKYALMYHLRVHDDSQRTFYCASCDVHFKSSNQLRLHMTTSMKHVTPDKLKFACETCGRCFITDKRREHHLNSVHLNKTEFACSECSKAYANKQSLRSHVQCKHKQTARPRDKICDICGKGFHNNVLLKNHMRTHTGERPFHCKLCPSTFSYSAALYTHNRLVHLKLKRDKAGRSKLTPAPLDKAQWDARQYSVDDACHTAS